MIVAVALPMLVGATAFAVDLGHSMLVHNQLQSAADAAALAAIQSIDRRDEAVTHAVESARINVPERFGTVTEQADVVFGAFDTESRVFFQTDAVEAINAVRVTAMRSAERGNAAPRFFGFIFGETSTSVSASAIAARSLFTVYEAPVMTQLDDEAGDYNRLFAYCFDYEGSGPPETRRSQMTLIADNYRPISGAPTIVEHSYGVVAEALGDYTWPTCDRGQSLSFRMHNVRHAKSCRDLWLNPDKSPRRPEHNYYIDTAIVNGVERFNLSANILETVRCDSLEECRPVTKGGVIPVGRNREPHVDTRPCLPGKFMYFGWEDRPGTRTTGSWTHPDWTDRDYDDLVYILACPEAGMLGYGVSRLVE